MNKNVLITAIAALTIGAAGGYLLAPDGGQPTPMSQASSEPEVLFWRNPMNPAITSPVFMQDEMGMDYIPVYAEEAPKEKEVLFWRNPMNPAITSPVFMQDEMGMDYIPVYADGASGDMPAGTVTIDPTVVQNIGVRTAAVEQRPLARQINALGHVDFNEERLARLHPKTSGWIEHLDIEETGTQVNNDTILMSIYSPDLVAAQQEYVVALSNAARLNNSASKSVVRSARERLELFDVPEHQVKELEKSRKPMRSLHIHSPFKGRVMKIGVREGQYVTPKDELYLIADLSRIWVYVDVYEDDLPWIKVGDQAELSVRAAPGQKFRGEVSFIHPTQDPKTRTVRVRLEFDNPGLILKPGMFANVELHVDSRPNAVVVPSEAIVRSGDREQLFVAKGGGTFEPREVVLGISAAGYTQIMEGVSSGEQVVVSSQFLIDSESKLRETTAKMMAAEPVTMDHSMHEAHGSASVAAGRTPGATDMDMNDMSMGDMDMSDIGMDDMDMGDMSMDEMSVDGMSMDDMRMQEQAP